MRNAKKSRRQRQLIQLAVTVAIVLLVMTAFVVMAFESDRNRQTDIPPDQSSAQAQDLYREVDFSFGRGYIGDGWQLYFNEPDESADRSSYTDGIDAALAMAINNVQRTLDIAAFELNNQAIIEAIENAHQRGVTVRIMADDKHGLEDEKDPALRDFREAGIPVEDDQRSGLMHNKFMILDSSAVWTGSWNYTVNGTYRNNNNALVLEHPRAVSAYQAEFDEMFLRGEYGSRSTDDGIVSFAYGEGEISIIFAAEADEISALQAEIARAERSIRIMTFVFSLDELAEAILDQAADPAFTVQGIFENRNSTADWSQLPPLHCAGANMRQDGNHYTLHHKVMIIDEDTVITGSFNFSAAASKSNDENIVIVRDSTIAGLYLEEWERIWDSAEELAPEEVVCN